MKDLKSQTLLRNLIREQINEILKEEYESGDTMISSLSDLASSMKKPKKRIIPKSVSRKLGTETPPYNPDPDHGGGGDILFNADTESVKLYYDKKHRSDFDDITITISNSPSIANYINEYNETLYNRMYEEGKKKVQNSINNVNNNSDPYTKDAIETASASMGVSKELLYFLMSFETGGSTGARDACNQSGYCGLFQFGDAAASTTGFNKADLYDNKPNYEKILNNAIATTRLAKAESGKGIASELGDDSFLSVWLNHNQGAAGSKKIYDLRQDVNKSLETEQAGNNIGGSDVASYKDWLTAWWGYCAGAEAAVKAATLPVGEIKIPSPPPSPSPSKRTTNTNNSTSGSPASSSTSNNPEESEIEDSTPDSTMGGQDLANQWITNMGLYLKSYPNFAEMKSDPNKSGVNNYRAGIDILKGNHDKDFFDSLFNDLGITNVIILNQPSEGGNEIRDAVRDSKNVAPYYYPIGHPDEFGNNELPRIFEILDQGNTLIHCKYGADRTGSIVGRYYVDRGIMTPQQAVDDHMKYQGKDKNDSTVQRNIKFITGGN